MSTLKHAGCRVVRPNDGTAFPRGCAASLPREAKVRRQDFSSIPHFDLAIRATDGLPYAVAEILRAIAGGRRPDDRDLTSAPVLVGWWRPIGTTGVLRGIVYDHRDQVDGTVTEIVALAMDREKGWVWSGDCFWRLGKR